MYRDGRSRWVARIAYDENYSCYPMRDRVTRDGTGLGAEYAWRFGGNWLALKAEAEGEPALPAENTIEQYISEYYWRYSRQRDGGTVEYQVMHPQVARLAQHESGVRRQ